MAFVLYGFIAEYSASLDKYCAIYKFLSNIRNRSPRRYSYPLSQFHGPDFCSPGSPNQANRRRRSHRIVAATGSAPPNQAGEETGENFAGLYTKRKREVSRPSFFFLYCPVLNKVYTF